MSLAEENYLWILEHQILPNQYGLKRVALSQVIDILKAEPLAASSPPADFTRLFLTTLTSFDWLDAPETVLDDDGDIAFDWHVGTGCVSVHVDANGRGGFAALVGGDPVTGTFQLPEWPEELTQVLTLLMASPSPSSPAWEPISSLIAQWRKDADELDEATRRAWVEPDVKRECADELEALLPPAPKEPT